MSAKITDGYFEYEKQKYFRRNAHTLELGVFGQKKDSPFAPGFLEREDVVKREHLESRVKTYGPIEVNWESVSQSDIGTDVKLKFFGIGAETAQDISLGNAKTAKLKLIMFYVDEGPLKTMLNTDASAARQFLAKEGNDGRIVSGVWTLMDGELSNTFSSKVGGSLSVKVLGQSIAVSASNSKSGTSTVQLAKGSTFAYMLHKVKKWTDKSETKIENMESDYKGPG